MSHIQNILKIKYTDEGYLPYYPYHLISEDELLDAAEEYILENYSCTNPTFKEIQDKVMLRYYSIVDRYRDKNFYDKYPEELYGSKPTVIPDWIYSYMLGTVINNNSKEIDKHDILTMLNLDNVYDDFDEDTHQSIYSVSLKTVGRYPDEYRQWDMFWFGQYHPDKVDEVTEKPTNLIQGGEIFTVRPPSIFGEPHVIRTLRLEQVSI